MKLPSHVSCCSVTLLSFSFIQLNFDVTRHRLVVIAIVFNYIRCGGWLRHSEDFSDGNWNNLFLTFGSHLRHTCMDTFSQYNYAHNFMNRKRFNLKIRIQCHIYLLIKAFCEKVINYSPWEFAEKSSIDFNLINVDFWWEEETSSFFVFFHGNFQSHKILYT